MKQLFRNHLKVLENSRTLYEDVRKEWMKSPLRLILIAGAEPMDIMLFKKLKSLFKIFIEFVID